MVNLYTKVELPKTQGTTYFVDKHQCLSFDER